MIKYSYKNVNGGPGSRAKRQKHCFCRMLLSNWLETAWNSSHCTSQPNNQLITFPGPPRRGRPKFFSLASLANPPPH